MLYFLLLYSFLFSKAFSQESIGCFVEGECRQSLYTGVTQVTSPLECLVFCQGRDDCNYYTHYNSTNACFAWLNCPEFNSDGCTDCVSGDVSCDATVCSAPGLCTGLILDFTVGVQGEDSCLDRCTQIDGCEWYSYESEYQFCILTSDCNDIDTCLEDTCLHGQRQCTGGEQPELEKTKIFVAGGRDLVNVEVINLAADGKTCTASYLPTGRETPASLLTVTGEPLFCGGYPSTDECVRYSEGSDAWAVENVTLMRPRYNILSIEVSPNKYWILGGNEDTSDIYENGVFMDGPMLPEDMANPCGVKVNDNLTFVASSSGLSVYLFDWRTMEFTSYPDTLIYPAQASVCGFATNGTGQQSIVIASGDFGTRRHQIIDLQTMTAREGASLQHSLSGGDSIPYGNNTFLVVGGYGLHPNLVEYDPESEVFVEREERLQNPRFNAYVSWVDDSQVICN